MEHVVVGDAATCGDLQYAGPTIARVVRRVTKCAPCRCVRRKDEAIRPASNESLGGRIGDRDVRQPREERNPSVSDDDSHLSASEEGERMGVGRTARLAHCGGPH